MNFSIYFLAQDLYYLLNIQWVEILGKTSIDLHFNVELWENLQLWILLLYNIIPFYPPISCPTVYGNENYTKFIECPFYPKKKQKKMCRINQFTSQMERCIKRRAFVPGKGGGWYPSQITSILIIRILICGDFKLDRVLSVQF